MIRPTYSKHQRTAFAPAGDGMTHQRREDHVGHKVDQEQRRYFVHFEAKPFDHHEGREDDEYLPSRARHELQCVIEPVPATQNEGL